MTSPASSARRPALLVLLLSIPVFSLLFFWSSLGASAAHGFPLVGGGERAHTDFSGLRVGIQDGQAFHEEVFGAALYSFNRAGAQVSTYHPEYRAGFSLVTEPLFAGRTPQPLQEPSAIVPDLLAGKLDVAVITSGDHDWLAADVLGALEHARDTQVVLILHQMEDFGVEHETLRQIADEGRLTLVGLGQVVTDIISRRLMEWAVRDQDTAWDKVAVEVFVPIFPVPAPRHSRPKHSVPSRVVIQGGIVHSRRKYKAIMADLRTAILEHPAAWGYQPSSYAGSDALEPIPGHPERFTLHLLGFVSDPLDVPKELENVVVVPGNTDYRTYFDDLQSMDLLVPAFASSTYLTSKTSSSIPAGILAGVPILASGLHLGVYDYLRPPAAVAHPSSMGEIEAIRRLRAGEPLWNEASQVVVPASWLETSQDPALWEAYRASLYDANEDVWARVASRLA